MRRKYISFEDAGSEDEIINIAPWGCRAIEVEGGYEVFESISDFHQYMNNIDDWFKEVMILD